MKHSEDVELTMSLDRQTLSWQPVEAEEVEEERRREQTEAQEAVLDLVRELGEATVTMVSKAIEGNTGNVWKRLNTLWKNGKLEKRTVGKSFYYSVPHHNGTEEQSTGQLALMAGK